MAAGHRRFRRRSPPWVLLVLLAVWLAWRIGWQGGQPPHAPVPEAPLPEGDYQVLRVVDGDTLIVRPLAQAPDAAPASEGLRVRLLGIDCPESVRPDYPVEPWGPEAAQFTREFVAGGLVRLQFDRRRMDRYDRWLAYVAVGDRLLNEELVRAGLARVRTYAGDSESLARRLRAAEQEAKQQGRGIWQP